MCTLYGRCVWPQGNMFVGLMRLGSSTCSDPSFSTRKDRVYYISNGIIRVGDAKVRDGMCVCAAR